MTEIETKIADQTVRTAWEQPELRRIEAGEAEAAGGGPDDGVIGVGS